MFGETEASSSKPFEVFMLSQLFRTKSIAQLQSDPTVGQEHRLHKSLTLLDLTCFGIAAVIGAGIFSTIGKAAASGGPAVSVLFVLTATACLFSALCYAEFASRIPVSGSAYTYAYASFGELCAWLIGWNLLLEYAIGNSTIAFSWSDYFVNLLKSVHLQLPDWLITDYYSCSLAVRSTQPGEKEKALIAIWESAPSFGGWKLLVDLPALLINFLVSILVYIGIQESKIVSNAMVFLKMAVVILVILVGFFFVKPANWSPFAPNGVTGVLAGISSVFFTFIGFDAISTTAEECKDAKRDLPLATILTLLLCTVLYVILSFVLTGMVPYSELDVEDPLAVVFEKYQLDWLAGIISVSAVVAITSVFLVFQIGQPRIFMSMARDGLLPRQFAKVHPRYRTPGFATIVTCIGVALPTLFLNSDLVLDLCSMGTLFAFTFVSAGVLMLESTPSEMEAPGFRVPYVNGKWWMPLSAVVYTIAMWWLPANHQIFDGGYWRAFLLGSLETASDYSRVPYAVFYGVFLFLAFGSWRKNWSLIPVLGVITNLYLIAGLGAINWLLFLGWCSVGLAVYFLYGFWNSRLRHSVGPAVVLLLGFLMISPSSGQEPKSERNDLAAASAIERGVRLLKRSAENYPSYRECFACHHQTHPLLVLSAWNATDKTAEEILQFTRESLAPLIPSMRKGGSVGGKALTVGYAGWTLAKGNEPRSELTDALVQWVVQNQKPDGGWAYDSYRPPACSSRSFATSLAILTLDRFSKHVVEEEKIAEIRKTAAQFIANCESSRDNNPLSTEDRIGILWAYRLLASEFRERSDPERNPFSIPTQLFDLQQHDGGWAQESSMPSDAYSTGMVLVFLAGVDEARSHPGFRSGVDYLLRTQAADGSWHVSTRARPVQEFFDNGDPYGKDQFISIMATAWSTLAILESCGKSQSSNPFLHSSSLVGK